MLSIRDQRVMIWKIEDKSTHALVQMTSSRKDKKTNEYKNSTWSFVRFVGEAYKKIGSLSEKDRIIVQGGVSKEPYNDKDGNKKYPENPQIVVFNWEPVEESSNKKQEESVEDDNLPF